MALRPIEDHLADFLLQHRDPRMKDYRRRCLEHWREHYGQAIAARVEAMVKERWNQSPGKSKRSGS